MAILGLYGVQRLKCTDADDISGRGIDGLLKLATSLGVRNANE
jgi:hypothetical protein